MSRFSLSAALAASALLPAPAAHAGDWGGIFSAVTLTSDYRYQGVSSTDRQPALQGYVHWWRPDGFYLGAFGTQVGYGYPGSPSVEIDLYGGRTWRFEGGRTELKAEGMVTTFPDNETPGPTFDFVQAKVAAKRTEGPLSYGAAVAFVPDGPYVAGRGWRVESETSYALAPDLTLRALGGHIWIQRGQDRSYWELGVARTWKHLTFEARYVDTNLSRRQCGFNPDICGPALVGRITAALPPIL